MTTLLINAERPVQGPISRDGMAIVNQLIKNGATEPATLRGRVALIRSRFWKTVFDLKDLQLVTFNH